ncbi:hypothetical protein HPB49_021718 [Dermacentor silvarum]|uniref:Uncharacterized protein n=1 Tax=Dermacentor silvarum TaxID=543639 RepID=A0ACB8DRK1_DERSI|nr:myeloid leukemia factor 2-like [Dermacentor silvarum]KAH7974933.1 hypothetical protein HPB49_021718 [Dermacentor silvarum]
MSGARECTPTGVLRAARRAQSPASGDPPSDDQMQGNVTVGHGGDHRLRQSITIKSKVRATVASDYTFRVRCKTVESSCSAKTVVTCTSERGSSTRSVVQQRSTTSGGHAEVVRATTFSREMSNGAMATIETYEDSRSGIRQLSVGRHIGDRSHLSEKSRNEFTGEEEKTEQLVNIPYEELGGFESEWKRRMARN